MSVTKTVHENDTTENTQNRVIESNNQTHFKETAQTSFASSVSAGTASARGASSTGTAVALVGASAAVASTLLSSPLINSSASLGLGKLMRLVICALE